MNASLEELCVDIQIEKEDRTIGEKFKLYDFRYSDLRVWLDSSVDQHTAGVLHSSFQTAGLRTEAVCRCNLYMKLI